MSPKNTLGIIALVLAMTAFVVPPTDAEANSETYCISGTSSGSGWTFVITSTTPPAGGWEQFGDECAGVPADSSCEVLTQAFVDCINNALGGGPGGIAEATVDPNDPCCFQISSGHTVITLEVGPAGGPVDCEVTEAGCDFNPTIIRVSTPVPTLTPWAIAGVMIVLMITGIFMVRRRVADPTV